MWMRCRTRGGRAWPRRTACARRRQRPYPRRCGQVSSRAGCASMPSPCAPCRRASRAPEISGETRSPRVPARGSSRERWRLWTTRRRHPSRSAGGQHALEQEGLMLEQRQDTGHAAADETSEARAAIYHRPMPGGGYVDVEVDVVRESADEGSRVRGRVTLERRAEENRRTGHRPPVVAEFTGDDVDVVMADLFRLACDNAALARSMLRWQSSRLRSD